MPVTPLPAGPQTVEMSVGDRAGNHAETIWKFTEEGRVAGGIKAVTDNAIERWNRGIPSMSR